MFWKTHAQVSPYQRNEQANEVCQRLAEQQQVFCGLRVPSWASLLRLEQGEEKRQHILEISQLHPGRQRPSA